MKREMVLFYMTKNKFYSYKVKKKIELIKDVDNSSFFKFGEISDKEKCENCIYNFINNNKIINNIIKPDFIILYNNYSLGDSRYILNQIFLNLPINKIKFYKLSDVLQKLNIIDYIIDDKTNDIIINKKSSTNKKLIIGGRSQKDYYFSDDNIIWNTFTKMIKCDTI